MAICPICKADKIPERQPGLGSGKLITCKSANCRRLYLLAQTRRNWRTHRDRERIRAGEVHPCYQCGVLTVLKRPTCGAPDCVRKYRSCGQWRAAKEKAQKRAV